MRTMKYRLYIIQNNSNSGPSAFTYFGTKGSEQGFDLFPINIRSNRIIKDRL